MTPHFDPMVWYDSRDDLPKWAWDGAAFYVGYLREWSIVMWHDGRFRDVVTAAPL